MRIDREYVTSALVELVRINSINPAFSAGATDERVAASWLGERLRELGMEVTNLERVPGRPSVVGRLPGSGGGRSIMLYGHLDTVGIDGMPNPFSGEVNEGRVYGRGSYDMKGGLAACLGAVRAIRDDGLVPAGDILIVGVADEEMASLGTAEVIAHVKPDAAIVTEATGLDLCVAHKGFCWIEIETTGRAAHGSDYRNGVDANLRLGPVLTELASLERALRSTPPHPLLGPPTLHAPMIRGGTGYSTYSPSCRLTVERRTLPGETDEVITAEIEGIVHAVSSLDDRAGITSRMLLSRPPFEVSDAARVVGVVREAATRVLGVPPRRIGQPSWMDSALLAEAGIETVIIGPGGEGAHSEVEYVELESVIQLAEVLARAAVDYTTA